MHPKVSEEWRAIPGFNGTYEASSYGQIRSVRHKTKRGMRGGIIRKQRPDKNGYMLVDLFIRDEQFSRKVHRLVLESFIGPCPEGLQACHYPDRNRANNYLDNLRWDTVSANRLDSVRHGTHPTMKFSNDDVRRIFSLREVGMTHRAIAAEIGCSKPYVEKILYKQLRLEVTC